MSELWGGWIQPLHVGKYKGWNRNPRDHLGMGTSVMAITQEQSQGAQPTRDRGELCPRFPVGAHSSLRFGTRNT